MHALVDRLFCNFIYYILPRLKYSIFVHLESTLNGVHVHAEEEEVNQTSHSSLARWSE